MYRKAIRFKVVRIVILGVASHCLAAPRPVAQSTLSQDAADATDLQAVPKIETTGFEPPEWDAFTSGQSNFVCGATYWSTCTPTPIPNSCTGSPTVDVNCCSAHPNSLNGWYVSSSSQQCHEPHIDTANPANPGGQHLRFARDPAGGNPAGCVGFDTACRVNAFTPDMGPQIAGDTTISFDLSISNLGGASFEFFTVGSDGIVGTYMRFDPGGMIFIHHIERHEDSPVVAGNWLPGGYHSVRIEEFSCHGFIRYFYDNQLVHETTTECETLTVRRAVLQTDNGGGVNEFVDIDNYSVQRGGGCPILCGNGVVEPGETCEPEVGPCPPNRCAGANQPDFCTCRSICTSAQPCPLHNGENGPFIAPFDPILGGVFSYTGDPGVEAFTIDTCGSTGVDTLIDVYDATDLSAAIASNNDCCNPNDSSCGHFGIGSTSRASCYNQLTAPNLDSCSCVTAASSNSYVIILPDCIEVGASIRININKMTSCEGVFLGSCCDSYGDDFGCTDNVEQASCLGPHQHWNNEKCANVTCLCIPDCTGRVCGGDGCGGSCGDCDNHNVCDGMETCDPNGQCVAGTSLNCDDGLFCNGPENCHPQLGCQPGAPLSCNDGIACTIDQCNEAIRACTHTPNDAACDDGVFCNGAESCTPTGCVSGTPPCTADEICNESAHSCSPRFTPIPTVSQWGLVVIAVAILIAAKVAGRRNPG